MLFEHLFIKVYLQENAYPFVMYILLLKAYTLSERTRLTLKMTIFNKNVNARFHFLKSWIVSDVLFPLWVWTPQMYTEKWGVLNLTCNMALSDM